MESSNYSSLNLLLDSVEGTNLLLEYYESFSRKIFSAGDYKSVLKIFAEELHKIYVGRNIELILNQDDQTLVKFLYNPENGEVAPAAKFSEKNTLYNYVLEQRQPLLSNNYRLTCETLGLSEANIAASSWLGIPMMVRDRVLGALVIWEPLAGRYIRLQDKQFLTGVTNVVSFAMENIYLCDYIVEKNGSQQFFQPAAMTEGTRNSVKGILTQLLHSVLGQAKVRYTGLFLHDPQHRQWKLLSESSRDDFSPAGGEEIAGALPTVPEEFWKKETIHAWRRGEKGHPLGAALETLLGQLALEAAVLCPFAVEEQWQGIWLVGYSRRENPFAAAELQMFQFVTQVIAQLIGKNLLKERLEKYESSIPHLEHMKVTGELASGAAHCLNNALSVIIGKGQMLQKQLKNTPHAQELKVILQAALDGANRIRRLQEFASKGRVTGKLIAVDINQLIQEAVEIARPRFEVEAQAHGIHYETELSLGKIAPINGDPPALREVFVNLINNALDAMPNGGKLSIQTTLKGASALVFVSDTGVGIPTENLEKIFDIFYTTKGEQGNGLGLNIAADIIKRHHGHIYVDSVPNKGSIFMIELPLLVKENRKNGQPREKRTPLSGRVLVVENAANVRETLAQILQAEGYEVVCAASAAEAILKFQKFQCQIVFADLSMPNVNGLELAEKLKKIRRAVQVFIITGWNQLDVSFMHSNPAIDGIVQKPFDPQQIRSELLRSKLGHPES